MSAGTGVLPARSELLTSDVGEHLDAFLRLAMLASAAHDRFAFADDAAALRFYEELYRRGGADFAPPAGRLLLVDGTPAGMFAVVSPAVAQRARIIGALMLARSEQLRAAPAVVRRLQLAAGTFVRPLATDGYLSRLAVHPSLAGQGVGRWLLGETLSATRALGLARCVLEVADTNHRAIALYQHAGFDEIGRGSTLDPESGRSLGYLHLARTV